MRVVKTTTIFNKLYFIIYDVVSRSEVMTRLIYWNIAFAPCQSGQAKLIYNLSSPSALYFKNLAKFSFSHYFYYESYTRQVFQIIMKLMLCGRYVEATVNLQCFSVFKK